MTKAERVEALAAGFLSDMLRRLPLGNVAISPPAIEQMADRAVDAAVRIVERSKIAGS